MATRGTNTLPYAYPMPIVGHYYAKTTATSVPGSSGGIARGKASTTASTVEGC